MTLAFVTFWILMIIFSDMTDELVIGLLHLTDQNIEMFKDEIKWLDEDLGHLENKADLTFGKDYVDVEE